MVVENKKDIFLAISINTGLCYCDEYFICNGGTNHIFATFFRYQVQWAVPGNHHQQVLSTKNPSSSSILLNFIILIFNIIYI